MVAKSISANEAIRGFDIAPLKIVVENHERSSDEGLLQTVPKGTITLEEIIEIIKDDWQSLSYNEISIEAIEFIKLTLESTKPKSILISDANSYGFLLYNLKEWNPIIAIENFPHDELLKIISKFLNPKAKFIDKLELEDRSISANYDVIIVADNTTNIKGFLSKNLNPNGQCIKVVNTQYLIQKNSEKEGIILDYSLENVISFHDLHLITVQKKEQSKSIYLADGTKKSPSEILNEYKQGKGALWIDKRDIKLRWDSNFHSEKNNPTQHNYIENRNLEDLCETIFCGLDSFKTLRKRSEKPGYMIITKTSIREGVLEGTTLRWPPPDGMNSPLEYSYLNEEITNEWEMKKYILRAGDIILGLKGSNFPVYLAKKKDLKGIVLDDCVILRSDNSELIYAFLSSAQGQIVLNKYSSKINDGAYKLELSALKSIRIPLPQLPFYIENYFRKYLRTSMEKEHDRMTYAGKIHSFILRSIVLLPMEEILYLNLHKEYDELNKILNIIREDQLADGAWFYDCFQSLAKIVGKNGIQLNYFGDLISIFQKHQIAYGTMLKTRNDVFHWRSHQKELMQLFDEFIPIFFESFRLALKFTQFIIVKKLDYINNELIVTAEKAMGPDVLFEEIKFDTKLGIEFFGTTGQQIAYNEKFDYTIPLTNFFTVEKTTVEIKQVGVFEEMKNGIPKFGF